MEEIQVQVTSQTIFVSDDLAAAAVSDPIRACVAQGGRERKKETFSRKSNSLLSLHL